MGETTAFDVANISLKNKGVMSAMKLQKLVYYSQAWSLVWDDTPLFNNKIEAWANGPVIPDLYHKHKGQYHVTTADFSSYATNGLTASQKESIDVVLDAYGKKSAQWLSDQTHTEAPWLKARKSLSDADRGDQEITLESMAEYYGSL